MLAVYLGTVALFYFGLGVMLVLGLEAALSNDQNLWIGLGGVT